MSTLSLTSVGATVPVTPGISTIRGSALDEVPLVGGVSSSASASQTPVAAGAPAGTPTDELSQESALADGAISMPARPLAEMIWHLRAAVNAGRTSVRTSRGQSTTGKNETGDGTPVPAHHADAHQAAKAYANVQTLGERRTPPRSVDIYHGKK